MGEGDGEVCEVEPCPQQDLNEFFSNSGKTWFVSFISSCTD